MNQKTYTTKEIADIAGIHPNTIRFYEDIEFITPPKRKKNGYRVYTELHVQECKLVRLALKAEVMQNGLRDKAIEIIRICAKLDFNGALEATKKYREMLESEIKNARAAIETVEKSLNRDIEKSDKMFKRKEAAAVLQVTSETLRTWERSGLLSVKRSQNGYRAYNDTDMERLNIIRTLRSANYSLSSILRLLTDLDKNEVSSVEEVLNTPNEEEDIISVCDKLIISLEGSIKDTFSIEQMILVIQEKFLTLQ